MKPNYQAICHNTLLKDLPQKARDILVSRFGLKGERQTLESIGQTYDITRERVRQIEEDGLKRIEDRLSLPACQSAFRYFTGYLKKAGNLKREDILLEGLAGPGFRNHVFFLLTLGKPFERFAETEDSYAFWAIDRNSVSAAKKAINTFIGELKKKNRALALPVDLSCSVIEISKQVMRGPEGLYGLRDWPDINPRGIKDKAHIVLKKEGQPLHFTMVAQNIGKDVLSQTVHNELIKDPRFVLVGRGLYGLREWGYAPGIVREVIAKILKEEKRPMPKEEILKKTLKQRYVKPNTILLNLQNKKFFVKNPQGKYDIRKA